MAAERGVARSTLQDWYKPTPVGSAPALLAAFVATTEYVQWLYKLVAVHFVITLVKFPRGRRVLGDVMAQRGGYLNIKNPACYVYPQENGCAPGLLSPMPRESRWPVAHGCCCGVLASVSRSKPGIRAQTSGKASIGTGREN